VDIHVYSMENPKIINKTDKNDKPQEDQFILDLVDLNDTLDLRKSNDRE
jgi:hypothetical protein